MMKKTMIALAMLATTGVAQAEISGNVAIASDYVFRGISQTDNQMAVQGGFDYAHDSGFYVGTWASNVDSAFFGNGKYNSSVDPQIELDMYAGYSGDLGNGLGYDLGYLRYQYPGSEDINTNEWHVTGSYSTGSIGDFSLSANYSPKLQFLLSDQSAWYWSAGYDTTLPWYEIGLSASVGYSTGDAFDKNDGDGLNDSYTDWSIGVSKSVFGVDLGLTYTDTDFSNSDDSRALDSVADSRVVFSVSKSL